MCIVKVEENDKLKFTSDFYFMVANMLPYIVA